MIRADRPGIAVGVESLGHNRLDMPASDRPGLDTHLVVFATCPGPDSAGKLRFVRCPDAFRLPMYEQPLQPARASGSMESTSKVAPSDRSPCNFRPSFVRKQMQSPSI